MDDATIVACREYSDLIEHNDDLARRIAERAEDTADAFFGAWLRGDWAVKVDGKQTVASIVSEDLCDTPGNPLHEMLAIVRNAANNGDRAAIDLMTGMGWEHGRWLAERELA